MRTLTKTLLAVWLAAFTGLAADEPVTPEQEPKINEGASVTSAVPVLAEDAPQKDDEPRPEMAPVVKIGQDFTLKAGESAEIVVIVGGTARIQGKVTDKVVVVAGSAEISGEVENEVIVVLGSVTAADGARIGGDVVSVGGKIEVTGDAKISGQQHPVDFGLEDWQVAGLKKWFYQCVVKMRPLAPQIGWVWAVAAVFFLFYLLVAIVFPSPVRACVEELGKRPATAFLMSLLTLFLVPIVMAILAATGLGLFVFPFILAALILGGIAGKVAIIEWLGLRLAKAFGPDLSSKPVIALILGALLVSLLYIVPVLGLLMFFVLSVWGLGSAVMATIGSFRRELPEKPIAPMVAPGGFGAPSAMGDPNSVGADPASTVGLGASAIPQPIVPPMISTQVPDAFNLPKASFWQRMAAGFLDLVIVGVLNGIADGPPLGFLIALAYFAGFWTWKQTTVGGIVVGLTVARMDGKPVNFAVALVRALGGFFSMTVLFLGFLWIAWDRDKQSWHDKIAGTVVLKQPRGTPLVCL